MPKAGQKRSREGYIATFGTTVQRSIHARNWAQTDSRRNPIAPERPQHIRAGVFFMAVQTSDWSAIGWDAGCAHARFRNLK